MSTRRWMAVAFTLALLASMTTWVPAGGAEEPSYGDQDYQARIDEVVDQLGIDTPWRAALEAVINPDDYVCEPTEFFLVISELIGAIDPAALGVIFGLGVDVWPTVYKALFDNDGSDEFIGIDGSETREQIKRHRDNKRFWDAPTDDVLLMGMHGSDIADDAKMVPTVMFLLGVDAATAQFLVDLVQALLAGDPGLGFDHPLWTLNAFAFSADGMEIVPGQGVPDDKIVMGDGLLDVIDELGLSRNGPDVVHAHEFAHHVQFEIGAFDSPLPPPEATRRTELMADGFAAYYLAHARGAAFQTKRVVDTVESLFQVGDCFFESPSHHGTPNQRAAAATWGADLADNARPQGKIRGSVEMLDLFEAQFPILIAPDA